MGTRRGFLKRIISAGAGAGALVVGGAPALPQDSEELAAVKLEIAKLELLKLQMEAYPPTLIEHSPSIVTADGSGYKANFGVPLSLPFAVEFDEGAWRTPNFDLMGKTVSFKRPGSLLEEVGRMHGRSRANKREAWLESAFQSQEEDA